MLLFMFIFEGGRKIAYPTELPSSFHAIPIPQKYESSSLSAHSKIPDLAFDAWVKEQAIENWDFIQPIRLDYLESPVNNPTVYYVPVLGHLNGWQPLMSNMWQLIHGEGQWDKEALNTYLKTFQHPVSITLPPVDISNETVSELLQGMGLGKCTIDFDCWGSPLIEPKKLGTVLSAAFEKYKQSVLEIVGLLADNDLARHTFIEEIPDFEDDYPKSR